MKTYKYIGFFKNEENDTHQLECNCSNFLEAFFLLTADAIRSGKHYQLSSIVDERGDVKKIADINNYIKSIFITIQ
jgi:hypothetical protein